MLKKSLYFFLFTFLLVHTLYSFIQYTAAPLDGDMADIIVPSHWYSQVLEDPLGFSVLTKNEVYCAPNRFFGHWSFSNYFKTIPLLISSFTGPAESVYIASAMLKIFTQLLLIFVIAKYISGAKTFTKKFLIACCLVAPFFIAYRYYRFSIMADSITFSFFYPLPLALLMLYFYPLYAKIMYGKKISPGIAFKILMILLALIVCFYGPIIPGIVLVICAVVVTYLVFDNLKKTSRNSSETNLISAFRMIPKDVVFYMSLIALISAYSFYIGLNNFENTTVSMPLSDRYGHLFKGLYELPSSMPLLFLLFFMIIFNSVIIRKYFFNNEGDNILNFLKVTAVICILYILLLPLGGYRTYRPDIIRFDTIQPVTVFSILLFGITSFFLIKNLTASYKKAFICLIVIMLGFFCIQNRPVSGDNDCERMALKEIGSSEEKIVLIKSDCNVLAWDLIRKPEDSELNSELLMIWDITKEKKLYYQK